MQQFTRRQDLEYFEISDPVRMLVEHVLAVELSISKSETLSPDDGQIYLVEMGDDDQSIIQAIGSPLSRRLFEDVSYLTVPPCFVCIFLRDNQCCITLIIPDREWLNADWKAILNRGVEEGVVRS
jgi:hypothetical protein